MMSDTNYIPYKRSNHFREWIEQISGHSEPDIPDQIWSILKKEIRENELETSSLTARDVRMLLKQHKLNKYYEHVPYIRSKISGRPEIKLNEQLKFILVHKFDDVNRVFQQEVQGRLSFFSYNWLFRRLLEVIKIEHAGDDDVLNNAEAMHKATTELRKSYEHAWQQWKKITEILDWPFLPVADHQKF